MAAAAFWSLPRSSAFHMKGAAVGMESRVFLSLSLLCTDTHVVPLAVVFLSSHLSLQLRALLVTPSLHIQSSVCFLVLWSPPLRWWAPA